MITVTDYFDYRQFLSDLLGKSRRDGTKPSYRVVAEKANIDPSLFTKILKGTRNISPEQALSIAGALGLDRESTEYFELLIRFSQARSLESKRFYFEKLLEKKKAPSTKPLTGDQYEYYSNWYYTVIRELLHFCPVGDNYKEIAKMLIPPIKTSEAKDAVILLEKLGIIKKNNDGTYALPEPFVTAGPGIQAFAIKTFQAAMLDLAKDALVNMPKEMREISTLTVSLSNQGFQEVIHAIRTFKEKLMDIVHNDDNISGVYQINFQAFPVTRDYKKDNNSE